jgi:hypothetical protein
MAYSVLPSLSKVYLKYFLYISNSLFGTEFKPLNENLLMKHEAQQQHFLITLNGDSLLLYILLAHPTKHLGGLLFLGCFSISLIRSKSSGCFGSPSGDKSNTFLIC